MYFTTRCLNYFFKDKRKYDIIPTLNKIFCKLSILIKDISPGANVSAAEWMWMTCQAQQDFSQFGARS